MPQEGVGGKPAKPSGPGRDRLRDLIRNWKQLRERIEKILDDPGSEVTHATELANLRGKREDIVNDIQSIIAFRPKLRDDAIDMGFRADLLPVDDEAARGGGGGGDKGASPAGGDDVEGTTDRDEDRDREQKRARLRAQAIDNRLLGDKGKDYDLVRGPKGSFVVRYKFRIKGEEVTIGLRIKKDDLEKFGFKTSDAKSLTRAQLKRVKNIGWVDQLAPHIRKGDSNIIKSLTRSLRVQYGGQPILENDQVMGVIIANSMFDWTPEEFQNQLRNTKWWQRTNDYQREWQLAISKKQRQDTVRSTMEQVVDSLEDFYGFNWTKFVDGGMKKAREWATTIASGKWGEPGQGFEFWASNQFDKAANIENTPAWIQNQQEAEQRRRELNRPEDMFEELRSQAMAYLGQTQGGKPMLDKATLQGWAGDLVTGKRSEADWGQFLRQQLQTMHPYFDPNIPFVEQAAPYKGLYEDLMGDTLDWGDPLLRSFQAEDQDRAMSLHEYELMLRDPEKNPAAWQRGTRLWEEGLGFVAELEQKLLGVTG